MLNFKKNTYSVALFTLGIVLLTVFFLFGTSYQYAKADCAGNYADCISINCTTIEDCVSNLVRGALTLAFPLGVLFIILAGFKYVTAQGDPGKIKSAHEILTWTIIGLAIAIAAQTLAIAFQEFFKKL